MANVKTDGRENKDRREIDDHNVFHLAIAVLAERVQRLSIDDRNDLFQLLPAALSEDTEERDSAIVTINEIMEQHVVKTVELESNPKAATHWLTYISEKIRDVRKAAHLTQSELAARTGIDQSHISRLENGEHSPSHHTLNKIAEACGVEVKELDPSISTD